LPVSIVYRIFRSAWLTVEHRDYPGAMDDHPVVSNLINSGMVSLSDNTNQVGLLLDPVVEPFPI